METFPDSNEPDWQRLFPTAGHRWQMGVRRGDTRRFFETRDPTGRVCAERSRWLAEDPERYSALLPEAEPALRETVQLARSLGATIDTAASLHEQLLALGRIWEPDFTWMHPDRSDQHRLVGGVVCFPSSWALREKLGRTMSEIHAPVPGVNTQLDRPIETLFARQLPGAAWIRENANFSRDELLNHHPSRLLKPLDATITPTEFWVRLERQLLLKLPKNGGILFGIRVEPFPLDRFLKNPRLARRLADFLDSMSPAVTAYKGLTEARPLVIEWLRHAAAETSLENDPQPNW